MKNLKISLLFSSLILLELSSYSYKSQAANSIVNANLEKANLQPNNAIGIASTEHGGKPEKGGQVIESGRYHLEFVPEIEAKGIHMDFFLLTGDKHEAVPNAKVKAQVQLPDGTSKTLNMTYDAKDKHYTALLPTTRKGEYKVAILSEIKGKKIDGRFSFKRSTLLNIK
jgi:hypothetical protein